MFHIIFSLLIFSLAYHTQELATSSQLLKTFPFILLYAGKDTLKGKWFQKQKDPIFGNELKNLIKNNKVDVKPKVTQVIDHEVQFKDNTRRTFTSIIWATGFVPYYDWMAIEGVTSDDEKPIHNRGITNIKGLYFIGLPWQYQRGSALICGVSLDANYLIPVIISNISKA
ncbi:monooxygenase [Halalkalibacter hemicellulosilyticusJCM 9152]|uniref:Monooxygenase n=1 Tax=Halalkalibacter hemicellulosilyticusJCM 9152 TaxID=1236971 RepID=W4QK01_9BACI|nr:monooxygenase [Halalkalibacter hemicellulosilyticusJCM 9152]